MKRHVWVSILAASLVFASSSQADSKAEPRAVRLLNGDWQFQRDRAPEGEWKSVPVPSSFQSHEGIDWHGVGWYRRAIEPFDVPSGHRVLLHFEAAATLAEVWWNGRRLGTHLGGWTPFRFDVTELVGLARDKRHELRVRLDEKVGHNTQGFLPIVAPHFGGLWQDVRLIIVPDPYVDDLDLQAYGDFDTGTARFSASLVGAHTDGVQALEVDYRLRLDKKWTSLRLSPSPVLKEGNAAFQVVDGRMQVALPIPEPQAWSPANPNLYEVRLRLVEWEKGKVGDDVQTRFAFRNVEARRKVLTLNGKPLGIRGVLNWGYYPPRHDPNAGDAAFRDELRAARALGFNLMKFCLWVPPRRYFELCDEEGFLAWMEYPTWHPDLSKKRLDELKTEFTEFFARDRNHPSVVLRSLTCETGPSADLAVIKGLYDLAHRMVPGCLVEDDSSWISWNRVNDFYDDHPYGNNHTWVKTLADLNEYVDRRQAKPLLLGEAIAADTWTDPEPIRRRVGRERPFWVPGFLDANSAWIERMKAVAGAGGLDRLGPDSFRAALLMRKYQIETYRREVPEGGYVVSVIRDFPLAAMGLLDYMGRSKWDAEAWKWHGDTMLVLRTAEDRRSFFGDESINGELFISHWGTKSIKPSVSIDAELKPDNLSDCPISGGFHKSQG